MKKNDTKFSPDNLLRKTTLKMNDSSQSIHKEFQALNKALETSREELQSINAELLASNEKLEQRNIALRKSRDYAEAIVETIREPLIILDEELRVQKANSAFYTAFKVTREEAEGNLFYEIIGGQWNRYSLRQLLEWDISSGIRHNEFELKYNFPSLGERIMVLNARRLIEDDVKSSKILIAMEDVTDQRKEQQKFQRNTEAFKIMAENSPVMIWMADTDKNRTFFNNAWLHFTGRTLEQEYGHGWEEGIHPDDLQRSLNIYKTAFGKRKSYKKEYRLKRRDGEYRWVLSHGVPLFEKGVFSGYIGSCMDINYRVEQEQQKDEFIAVASHELKTPLTSIKVYTELLHQMLVSNNDMESASLAAKMDSQVDKLTRLIKEMLDVSRIAGKTLLLNKEDFDINDLIKEVAEDTQPTTKTLLIKALAPTGLISGDRERLRQVLVNLISNGIKYSPEADRILISSEREGGFIKVSVLDFGIGIPENIHGRIFERFFRASDPENTFPGIGLGLYISAEIIKRHKGKIWFNSKLGKGSTFWFSLPLKEGE
jgi:PAS domain S-box-containing protein